MAFSIGFEARIMDIRKGVMLGRRYGQALAYRADTPLVDA